MPTARKICGMVSPAPSMAPAMTELAIMKTAFRIYIGYPFRSRVRRGNPCPGAGCPPIRG
jgi:hypothetical protein